MMVDQMGDFKPIVALIGLVIIGMIIGVCVPDWYAKHKRRKAHKLYKMAQRMELKKDPEIIRFYRSGTYHVTKTISEEDQIEQDDTPEQEEKPFYIRNQSVTAHFNIPIFLGILSSMEEDQEDFDGVAESAIRIVNQEWQNRDNGNNEVTTTW